MARRTVKKKRKPADTKRLRLVVLVVVAALLVMLASPFLSRWWGRYCERSEIGDAVAALDQHGCMACHRGVDGLVRWRAYEVAPESLALVRSALMEGRREAPGMAVPMPAYGAGLGRRTVDRLVLGVGVVSGLLASPSDPELQVGRDIAIEMGCFGCHGPLGSGGPANLGARRGRVPGFWGAAFRDARQAPGGIVRVIRDGSAAQRAWWEMWRRPLLAMPAYGDQLDSTELELLVRYLEWLTEVDVTISESDSYHDAGGSG